MSLAIGLLGKKWRVGAAFNEKILVRIAYHAFCLQEVEWWVFYLLVVFGRTIKIFDMLLKYEIMRFFGLCLSRLKFSEPKLGLSRQNAKYHLKWRSHRAPRGCAEDEGGPLGVGLQEQASNHLKLLWSKAMVVSV